MTSRIGAIIDSSMCWNMWMLNDTCEYRAMPELVAQMIAETPMSQEIVRPGCQESPRARSRITPAM